jgi:hypothetical protein
MSAKFGAEIVFGVECIRNSASRGLVRYRISAKFGAEIGSGVEGMFGIDTIRSWNYSQEIMKRYSSCPRLRDCIPKRR